VLGAWNRKQKNSTPSRSGYLENKRLHQAWENSRGKAGTDQMDIENPLRAQIDVGLEMVRAASLPWAPPAPALVSLYAGWILTKRRQKQQSSALLLCALPGRGRLEAGAFCVSRDNQELGKIAIWDVLNCTSLELTWIPGV
jgi:hypothetical protein